ncbi:MAG TPA: hypothetical protein VMH82_02570 [Myxococcota bacterium]|nr:hypothetical protein [Myxococcota bacterium]
MTLQRFGADLRQQMHDRPYLTMAACVGVGWMLGRALPLRALVAVGGLAARAAAASAVEGAVRNRFAAGSSSGDVAGGRST